MVFRRWTMVVKMKLYKKKQQSNDIFLKLTEETDDTFDLDIYTQDGDYITTLLTITNEGKLKIIPGVKSALERDGIKSYEFQYNALGGIALE